MRRAIDNLEAQIRSGQERPSFKISWDTDFSYLMGDPEEVILFSDISYGLGIPAYLGNLLTRAHPAYTFPQVQEFGELSFKRI